MEEFDEEEHQAEQPPEDLAVTLDQVLHFCREEATPDDCRAVIAAAEGRLASFPAGSPAHAEQLPGVRRPAARGAEGGPARARLTWYPSGGLTIDTGTARMHVDGPVEETRFPPE